VCWICAHPGATERDYHNYMQSLITMYGWAVQGVERDGIHPPWAYTVGLTRFRQPELHADAPAPGTQAELTGGPLVEIVKVSAPWAHLNLAVEFFGRRVRGLQLVHADKHGRWPWDREYQGVRGGQPVLGVREPPAQRQRVG